MLVPLLWLLLMLAITSAAFECVGRGGEFATDGIDGRERDMLRARDRGDEYGEVGEVSLRASRMVRIERTMLSWMTARHSIRSSRNAVGVYNR